jgi:hypothetical protein
MNQLDSTQIFGSSSFRSLNKPFLKPLVLFFHQNPKVFRVFVRFRWLKVGEKKFITRITNFQLENISHLTEKIDFKSD